MVSRRSKYTVKDIDEDVIRFALERGDRHSIARYIRNGVDLNAPLLRKLFLDLLEKRWRWPRHRVTSTKTAERYESIGRFVEEHIDEGMPSLKALDLAMKEFKVAPTTVRNAVRLYRLMGEWDWTE